MLRGFRQINVFSEEPLGGNPLAVVLDSEGLSSEKMQEFARWMNLSETTFILPPSDPTADYRVRIFTPTSELPFAGHPTLGTCHAWRSAGGGSQGQTSFVQECPAGLISLRLTSSGLAFNAPPLIREGPVDEPHLKVIAAGLGVTMDEIVEARWIDNGPGWIGVLLQSAARVIDIDPASIEGSIGVVGLYPEGSEAAYELRAFFQSKSGTAEDPVTGSLNASVAQWMIATGRAKPPYMASQGQKVGAAGCIHVEGDPDGTVWIGGATVTVISGEVDL